MIATADVAIIGGGIHGCSTALHCARKGLTAIVIEKNTVGRHASGVNAGGVRRLGRDLAEVPLSVAAMEIWRKIADLVHDDCGFHDAAMLKVAENESDLRELGDRARQLRSLGFDHEVLLDRQELLDLLPAVSPHCLGALASLADGFADPYRTTIAFRREAAALGVRFIEEARVLQLGRERGTWRLTSSAGGIATATVVNCAGAWAGEIAAKLGEPVPVEAIAPMMIVTSRLPPFCDAVVSTTHRPLSFKQMPNGTVVIGGGRRGIADALRERSEIRFAELAKTARTAAEVFPIVRNSSVIRCWAGIEGRMPDDLPVIGPSGTEAGAFHAFGFSAHGFQLGPIVGSILSELIDTGQTNLPIAPFHIGRFRADHVLASSNGSGKPH